MIARSGAGLLRHSAAIGLVGSICLTIFLLPQAALSGEAAAPPATEKPAPAPALAEQAAPAADVQKINVLLVRELRERPPPLSLLDVPSPDDGVGGAKLAISDNNTTGKFLKQEFALDVIQSAKPDELVAETVKRVEGGVGFVVTDVAPRTLLAIADALKDKDAIIFNAGTPDDSVREEQCRRNVKHTAPSRSMLADALAQYMAWKRWSRWFLVIGPTEEDKAYAEALRRAAKRFGLKIVEERTFEYDPGSRRSDGGFEQIQQQIPQFTQKVPEHDVAVVSDEGGLFGEYFPYRTWDPKPVIGTAGLYAASWHPAIELWGGTQFQNRFKRMNNRNMRPLDYDIWMAVRSVGEAATRKKSANPKELIEYMRSPEFELAAFKGQKLTYRSWNGQLRQPILLVTGKVHVTVSPQPGFLHQLTELDTLGFDKPETKCKNYN
jgi:ABC transporter substrate binding protein (PQQ-dependent alcohol dehydrogenase system)